MTQKIESKQLDLFGDVESQFDISNAELTQFTKSSRSRSSDISGAINRMVKAKRYHEIANKLAQELLLARMENDKLKEKVSILTKAN